MEKPDQRNFIVAMVIMLVFVFGYQTFVLEPQAKQHRAAMEAAEAAAAAEAGNEINVPGLSTGAQKAELAATVEEALATSPRVAFDAESVDGSIRLAGARIDDLSMHKHFKTVERAEEVRLFRPENAEYGYYTTYYWLEDNKLVAGRNSRWTQVGDGMLTSTSPITLRLETDGLVIDRKIELDDNYMFTFTDTVKNESGRERTLVPLGSIERHGDWKEFVDETDPGTRQMSQLVHLGVIGVLDGNLRLRKYNPIFKGKTIKGEDDNGLIKSGKGGWFGLTDKYWMGALIPDQSVPFAGNVDRAKLTDGGPLEVRTFGTAITIPAGSEATSTNRIFAGAKNIDILRAYQSELGIPRMVDAIDWGFLYFLTKPFFFVILWLKSLVGGFGLAILAFTLLIKIPLIPLFNQSYKSMAKVKKLQEPMKEIQERFKEDPKRRQEEIMALYKREKANPFGGCLPILFTIPVFYALYKTLLVTIEMRHEPFLWMKDLSAPDPTAIGNLFGLIPESWWTAADVKTLPIIGLIIGIGILPLLYGVSMAATQSLSPPPPDPMQRRMMMLLPIVFMFVFAGFAGGLVLYWVWNNILSLFQQYFIMRRNGVETQFDKLIARLLGREKAET